jgi:hypothetical protein
MLSLLIVWVQANAATDAMHKRKKVLYERKQEQKATMETGREIKRDQQNSSQVRRRTFMSPSWTRSA